MKLKLELLYDPKEDTRDFGKDISIGFEVESVDQIGQKNLK